MAGGFGTRISEKSAIKPKPMVEIGYRSILWHILKIYSAHGINDFVICMGYKGHVIKKFFANYFLSMADVIFDLAQNKMEMHQTYVEPWRITLVDTGEATMTGGQLKRVREHLGSETFCITCGDGVTNQDISQLIALNRQQKKLATLSAVQPPGRFGAFTLGDDQRSIAHFREKLEGDGAWINGGFFVLEPKVIDHIQDDTTVWERESCKIWRATASWPPTNTPASGSRWARCGTRCCSKTSGPPAPPRAKCGSPSGPLNKPGPPAVIVFHV